MHCLIGGVICNRASSASQPTGRAKVPEVPGMGIQPPLPIFES